MDRLAPFVALLAAGCAPGPLRSPASRVDPVAVEVGVPSRVPSDPSPPEPVAEVPVIREPSPLACRLPPVAFTHSALRLAPAGPVFASIQGVTASLMFPAVTSPAAAVVEIDDPVVLLRAHIDAKELPLYAQKPVALGGFVYPHPSTALEWIGGEPGKLEVTLDASRVLAWPAHPKAALSCQSLGTNAGTFELRSTLTKKRSLPELVVRTEGAALSLEPAGTAVAALRAGNSAQVLESRRGETRILVDVFGYAVVGWVHASDLGNGFGAGYGRLGGRHRMTWRNSVSGRSCDRDLALYARAGEVLARVGHIKAGGRFVVEPAEPDPEGPPPRRERRAWLTVTFPHLTWLEAAEGARLLVGEAELAACPAQ